MVRLGKVRLDMVWFGYISFLYFITQKLGTCRIYKRALTGMATIPVSCSYKCLHVQQSYPVVIRYLYGCFTFKHCLLYIIIQEREREMLKGHEESKRVKEGIQGGRNNQCEKGGDQGQSGRNGEGEVRRAGLN